MLRNCYRPPVQNVSNSQTPDSVWNREFSFGFAAVQPILNLKPIQVYVLEGRLGGCEGEIYDFGISA